MCSASAFAVNTASINFWSIDVYFPLAILTHAYASHRSGRGYILSNFFLISDLRLTQEWEGNSRVFFDASARILLFGRKVKGHHGSGMVGEEKIVVVSPGFIYLLSRGLTASF